VNGERALLDQLAQGPQSGQALARALGLTRAGVWKRVQALRAAGVAIVADRTQGYALAQTLDLLDAAIIRAQLPDAAPAPELVWSIDSTQAELLRRGSEQTLPALLLAERQTRGRGRRGRVWQSPLAAHLYLSLALRMELPLSRLAGLSLAVGVSLADSLHALGYADVQLKWPNDLWVRGRKLGGVLVDVSGEVGGPALAVIGIGINVHMPAAFGARIDQPWCDLDGLAPPIARNALAARIIADLLAMLARFSERGLGDALARWPALDALRGCELRIDDGRAPFAAQALGLADDGGLRVRTAQGERVLYAGEVSVRGPAS
jgi:BirA family biotin operon repressor/biotin-[acetyl-CoA-carboxylase] ligase